jgi:hypothetical protein
MGLICINKLGGLGTEILARNRKNEDDESGLPVKSTFTNGGLTCVSF